MSCAEKIAVPKPTMAATSTSEVTTAHVGAPCGCRDAAASGLVAVRARWAAWLDSEVNADWDEILALLPQKRPARREELTVGYRIPAPNMELAARVLVRSAPELTPPRSVRQDGRPPRIERVDDLLGRHARASARAPTTSL